MPYDEKLAERIRRAFHGRKGVTERKMFGGLAFMLNGRMCCGVLRDDLVIRVTDDEMNAVADRPYVRPMDFTGRPLRGFVYVSSAGCRTAAQLSAWLARAERFVEMQKESARGR